MVSMYLYNISFQPLMWIYWPSISFFDSRRPHIFLFALLDVNQWKSP